MAKYLHYITAGILCVVVGIYHPVNTGAFWFILLAAFTHAFTHAIVVALTQGDLQ